MHKQVDSSRLSVGGIHIYLEMIIAKDALTGRF